MRSPRLHLLTVLAPSTVSAAASLAPDKVPAATRDRHLTQTKFAFRSRRRALQDRSNQFRLLPRSQESRGKHRLLSPRFGCRTTSALPQAPLFADAAPPGDMRPRDRADAN